ncbi:16338_t:CDS:1, partial [Funneliformis mosseae]
IWAEDGVGVILEITCCYCFTNLAYNNMLYKPFLIVNSVTNMNFIFVNESSYDNS